jgi:1-deoxy-D-xylulose-5-phosphate synthase
LLEADGVNATVVNCRFLKPLDSATLMRVAAQHAALLTIEEGTVVNGFGASVVRQLESAGAPPRDRVIDVLGVPDRVIEHASRAEQLAEVGLDVAGIARRARDLVARAGLARVRETA